MAITAAQVKELREKSGAGMMDCKKALGETNGNVEEAMQYLKEKGLAKAAKKAGRVAAEGAVVANINNSKGLLLELNCETDFAARSNDFVNLSEKVTDYFMNNANEEGDIVDMSEKFYDDKIENIVTDGIATIGENIRPRRFVKFNGTDTSYLHSYVHMGGKIGVLVEVGTDKSEAKSAKEVAEMADGIAMQIASMKPECVRTEEFPEDVLEKERDVFKAQVIEMGKPENIADKIVDGKIKKFVAENTLLEQAFVMNGDLKVKDLLKEVGQKVGAELNIVRFARFELGEGIEKKEDNFAEEVAAQIKK